MRIYKTPLLALSLLALAGCSSWQPMCPDNGFQYRICPQGTAQSTTQDLTNRLAALEKEREALAAELAAAKRESGLLSERVQSLESQLAQKDRELAALRSGAGDSSQLARQLSSAQSDLEQAKSRITDLERQLAAAQAGASTEKEQLAALQAGVGEKDQLAKDLAAAKQRNAELEAQLTALTSAAGDKSKLAADLAACAQRVADLERQLAERDKELAGLRGDLSSEMAKLREAQRGLIKALRPQIEKGNIMVDLNNERLLINLASSYLFGSGEDQLKPAGADALKQVGNILKDFPEYKVAVDGHTDNRPIRSALKKKFPTNKELSEARAANAAQALTEGGLGAAITHGYADTQPVVPNTTDAGRAKNRRVEIRVTK
ncbi:MAG: OmpA family protein [Nitrospira sp.]|jgi:chemotaxis protein MotB|nr:OmpA family protein [Nitrospira sp.]